MAKKEKRARSKTDKVVYSSFKGYWKKRASFYIKNKTEIIGDLGGDPAKDFELFETLEMKSNPLLSDQLGSLQFYHQFSVFTSIIEKKYTSIYLKTPLLLDFLLNNNIKESDINCIMQGISNNYNLFEKGAVINTPSGKESIYVVVRNIEPDDRFSECGYMITATMGDYCYTAGFYKGKTNWLDTDHINTEMGEVATAEGLQQIVTNLFMYMDCFSECVIDGVPDIICKGDDAKRKKTLTLHKDVEEVSRQAQITPHMRRGHFRFLQSDRYVNAKGKTVFVKPTMVKGKAKTVVEY